MCRSASEMAARASTRRSIKMGISQDSPAWATKSSDEAEPFGTQMFLFMAVGVHLPKGFAMSLLCPRIDNDALRKKIERERGTVRWLHWLLLLLLLLLLWLLM